MEKLNSNRITVAVATYNRNEDLTILLKSLEDQRVEFGFGILIIDNSSTGIARMTVTEVAPRARYLHEPFPGIVPARNSALNATRDQQAIIFVDDDEYVDSNWFATMVACAETYDAEVVFGPVVPIYSPSCAQWIKSGGYFERQRQRTGSPVRSGATNNALVRVEAFNRLEIPHFDASYSVTGGSDAELFQRMSASGAPMVWCNEAVVFERVPESRENFSWIWNRQVRVGSVSGRIQLKSSSKLEVIVQAFSRVALGVLRSLWAVIRLRPISAKELGPLARGIGLFGAVVGHQSEEYAR